MLLLASLNLPLQNVNFFQLVNWPPSFISVVSVLVARYRGPPYIKDKVKQALTLGKKIYVKKRLN